MTLTDEQPNDTNSVSTQDAKKHFAKNTTSNLLFFVFTSLTSLFMLRYQKDHLGIPRYGMIGLANAFVMYMQILTVALVGTTFRFVTMKLAQGEREEAEGYSSTHLASAVYASLILFPVCAVIAYFTPSLLVIPAGQATNVRILFLLVYVQFVLALLTTPYQMATYVRQRFDIRNYLEMLNQVFRYSTWIIMFTVACPELWQIGVGYVLGASVALVGTVMIVRRLAPDFHPSIRRFDKRKFVEMVRTGGWVGLDAFGAMLYYSTDMLVINRMLGVHETGRFAIIWGFALMFRTITATMGSIIAPTTLAAYARNERDAMLTNLARAVKFMCFGLAVPLGILTGLGAPFLSWLLGPDFASLNVLIWLMISHLVINSALEPVQALTLAANKLTVPCMATIISAVLKVALSILLIKNTHLGIVAVALAGLITFTLKQFVFIPIYAAKILSAPSRGIYRALVPGTLVFAGLAAVTLALSHQFNLATFPRLAGVGFALMAVAAAAIYFVAMNDRDRQFLRDVRPGRKRA